LYEIEQVTPEAIYGRGTAFPVIAYSIKRDGELICAGGLSWLLDRCWLWVEVLKPERINAVAMVRWGHRMLQVAERYGDHTVSAARDPRAPNSAKLLRVMRFQHVGFLVTNGEVEKKEVWEWQRYP
jgi:hypothetical protein